eukprot:CAMPEP_0197847738 /NCGR_PEP_ID=MMETSP1438-20131217/6936_1 /TAXON_ID=1461541 /ORGANISM="Pterosperma sp., Strain CCMP1384" /LENGTH=133 /DNA_ID=CAMNT_0043459745 /DNA_START=62 /DNA_END=463 /DNA_ORIENTATION=+
MTTCSAKISVVRVSAEAQKQTQQTQVSAPAKDQQSRRTLLALTSLSAVSFARAAVAKSANGVEIPDKKPPADYVYSGTKRNADAAAGTGGFKDAGGLFGCDSGFGCYNAGKVAEANYLAAQKKAKAAETPASE